MVVVESLAHALARGATPIAEILGGALTADAFHISAPEPTGRGASRAMTLAREHAGVDGRRDRLDRRPRDLHAAQRRDRDAGDQGVLRAGRAQGARSRSPKSMVGHLVGAAGIAIARWPPSAASATRCIAPTANLDNPDLPECDLDYVPLVARTAKVDTVMVNGFGFGGQNAVAIFRRYAG